MDTAFPPAPKDVPSKLILYVDGASLGNPGPSGIGVVVTDGSNHILAEINRYIGVGTNNQAEYRAAVTALQLALRWGASEVELFTDSELLDRQVRGRYKVKNPILSKLHQQVKDMCSKFKSWKISHIPRERNIRADLLAKSGADRGRGRSAG